MLKISERKKKLVRETLKRNKIVQNFKVPWENIY